MAETGRRRIEGGTSRTAEAVCLVRACSYRESEPHYHSDDYVAARLVPLVLRTAAHTGVLRHLIRSRVMPLGMYEYVIARTKYFDATFAAAAPKVEQVLILGAGYDSRGIRFADRLRHARVFEVDAPKPQADKRRGLELRHLPIPPNLVFVPVDFETENAADKLGRAGFERGRPTLCLLEGLTMYLEPSAIDSTFHLLSECAGPRSQLLFDYAHASVLRGEGTRYGERAVVSSVAKAGEAWRFGIDDGGVAAFLFGYGFEVTDEVDGAALERKYFTDESGRVVGRVNDTQALVTATRR